MATPFSYTVPNWREGSPNAAETAIYSEMMKSPAMSGQGGLMLNELAANRHGNERAYADELSQQHAFAQQQADRHAQAQSREDLLKLMAEKNPGSLGLAYNNPLLSPLLAGTDETMMGQHAQFNKQAADAEAYEKFGKGYRDFRYAGGYTPPEGMNTILAPMGVQISDTEPIDVTSARLRGAEQGIGSVTGNPNQRHGGVAPTLKIVRRLKADGTLESEYEATERTMTEANSRSPVNRPLITPNRSPVSDLVPQAPAPQQSQTAIPTAAPGMPQQQPGQGPTPAPGQTQAPVVQVPGAPNSRLEVAPSGTPGKPEAQKAGRDALIKLAARDRAGYQSVISRMAEDNGDVPVTLIPGTGWVLVGQNGRYFEIPGFTKSITTDRSGRNATPR